MTLKKLIASVVIGLVIGVLCAPTFAAMTTSVASPVEATADWWGGGYGDTGLKFLQEVETIIESWGLEGNSDIITFPTNGGTISNVTNSALIFGENSEDFKWAFTSDTITATSSTSVTTFDWGAIVPTANQMFFTPVSSAVGTVEGTVYYDTEDQTLYVRDNAGWVDLGAAAGGNSLDGAYNAGSTITVDAGAVTMTATDAANNVVLALVQQDTAGAVTATFTSAGTGALLTFDSNGTGADLLGSDSTWTVTKAGAASFASMAGAGAFTTLTSTGVTTLGDNTATVAVASTSWDVSSGGAFSGITTLDITDDFTIADGKSIKGTAVSAETWSLQVYDNDTGPAYVDAILFTNGNTPAIAIGDNNPTVAINSSDWDISTTGAMTGIGAITMDGLLTGTAGATITGAAINLNASDNNVVNIGTGTTTSTVTIGGAAAQTINVGDGAAAKTVTLGSSDSTSTTTLLSGSGALNLNASNNQNTNINTGSSTGTVAVGGTGVMAIDIGTGGTGAKTISIGDGASTGTTAVKSGSGGLGLNVSTNHPVNIGTGTTTGTVTIGGAGIQTINIGDGAAAKTVTLGSSDTTSTTTLLSGSNGINLNVSNNQPTNIGTGTTTGTVTVGGAGIQTINIGDGAAAKTVTLGSTDTTSTTTISSGSGGISMGGIVTLTTDVYVKKGGDATAANELDIGVGTFFDVAGATNITSIAAADSIAGRIIVLQFDTNALTISDGNNLKLAGDMVTSAADDTLMLISDGTDWWELSRSAN